MIVEGMTVKVVYSKSENHFILTLISYQYQHIFLPTPFSPYQIPSASVIPLYLCLLHPQRMLANLWSMIS